jgi:phospholipid/cholesterol/gamma-HCH transport system permease protein
MANTNTEAAQELSRSGDLMELALSGDWTIDSPVPDFDTIQSALQADAQGARTLTLNAAELGHWDSLFLTRLMQCANWCLERDIALDASQLPEGVHKLLDIATAVKPVAAEADSSSSWSHLSDWLRKRIGAVTEFSNFIGAFALSLVSLLLGKSNTRARDFFYFVDQVGPKALGIVTLLSLLMGMILAYMGAVQLRQLGAQLYVANLVAIGTVREMGALMTGIIMAGRTGAAYAAQLGTMQTNEEIDAIQTLGISPMEFLVTPRMLALIVMMPILVVYSDILGIIGGAIVAAGLDISPVQYFNQVQDAITWADIGSGLLKSLIFAVLIGIAGCQSGLQCGRSSAAVGEATTRAVVIAIVYLVVADSALNVLYDKVGI